MVGVAGRGLPRQCARSANTDHSFALHANFWMAARVKRKSRQRRGNRMPVEHFEYVIIGGGKGGKTLAAKLAAAGHQVAMIEEGMIGGSCINVTCIPTKTMVRSAKVAAMTKRAADFGIHVTFNGV